MRWLLLFCFVSSTLADKRKDKCLIVPNKDFGQPQPLILEYDSPFEVLYPNVVLQRGQDNGIELDKGVSFQMACPGTEFHHIEKVVEAVTCVKDLTFEVSNNNNTAFKDIKCKKSVTPNARWTGEKCNGDTMDYIEFGYNIQQEFLRLFLVCFDNIEKIAVYSVHVERPVIVGYQRNYQRTEFIAGDFYKPSVNITTVYTIVNQKQRFKEIFNSQQMVDKYIGGIKDGLYLARGHLTAKTDLLYGPEQAATFFYVNAVPQWQSFNAGNWFSLEGQVRKFIGNHGKNIKVYTGTYGVLTLPDETKQQQEMYIAKDRNKNNILPIPKLIYKVLHSETDSAGVAIIGINNPHLVTVTDDYKLCPDVCEKITWLKMDRENIKKGYIYCCDIKEFVKHVTSLPKIDVQHLLT